MNEHTDDWAKVQATLANPAWDFRTLDGITRDTSLPRERVERVLLRIRSMLAPPIPRLDLSPMLSWWDLAGGAGGTRAAAVAGCNGIVKVRAEGSSRR